MMGFEDDKVRFDYHGDFLHVTRGSHRWCFSNKMSYSDLMLLERLKELERTQW